MVYKWALQIPNLSPELTRRAYLYLPACYDEQPDARFPVMYMFDGHNVFFDEDATYGQSLGAWPIIWDKTDTPLIIAAVECNPVGNNRLEEYCPLHLRRPNLGRIRGRGRATMEWFIRDFKPMIDANLRTPAGQGEHADRRFVDGRADEPVRRHGVQRCFRPGGLPVPQPVARPRESAAVHPSGGNLPDTLIYMDYGGEEMANHAANLSALTTCSSALLQRASISRSASSPAAPTARPRGRGRFRFYEMV